VYVRERVLGVCVALGDGRRLGSRERGPLSREEHADSISAAFVSNPGRFAGCGRERRRRQRRQGRGRFERVERTNTPPRDLERLAQRFARREARVSPVSLRIGGPRAPRCTRSRRKAASVIDATPRGVRIESEHEAQASEREGPSPARAGRSLHREHTRHGCWVVLVRSADVGRNASSIATPGSVNSAAGHARPSSNDGRPAVTRGGGREDERTGARVSVASPSKAMRRFPLERAKADIGVETDSVRDGETRKVSPAASASEPARTSGCPARGRPPSKPRWQGRAPGSRVQAAHVSERRVSRAGEAVRNRVRRCSRATKAPRDRADREGLFQACAPFVGRTARRVGTRGAKLQSAERASPSKEAARPRLRVRWSRAGRRAITECIAVAYRSKRAEGAETSLLG
jgi:hypothetical protein